MDVGNRAVVATRVPPELLPRLDLIAESRSESRSSLVRELIIALLDGRVILSLGSEYGQSARDFRASKVGQAATKYARDAVDTAIDVAAGTQNIGGAAQYVDPMALDIDQLMVRAARLLEEGR